MPEGARSPLTHRLVDSLYTEAMLLADEMRGYLAGEGAEARATLGAAARVAFVCEALKGTTRLMQVIAWLLTHRAIGTGDLPVAERRPQAHRLGPAPLFHPSPELPAEAARLLVASSDLYERAMRLDSGLEVAASPGSPARSLLERLERSL